MLTLRLPVHEAERAAVEVNTEGQGGTKIDAKGCLPRRKGTAPLLLTPLTGTGH